MKRDDLTQRRDQIVELLSVYGSLSAQALADRLAVSVQTIRADLRDLDESALVQRRNGVARLRQQSENMAYLPREALSRSEKQSIAVTVKNLVPNGARVALGTGTTVEQCARMLATRTSLFVATNSLHAAMALQQAPQATVVLAGGEIRLRDMDLIGVASVEFFANYRVDQAIFSCGGLSEEGEVLDYNAEEVAARQAIVRCARQSILVVDSTKFGRDLPCRVGKVWDYDRVVTAADLGADVTAACAAKECEILSPTRL
ncbi:DeoR/GlpR family DNA-binding transcription regulator [Rhodovibrionaceae bacterium A322]